MRKTPIRGLDIHTSQLVREAAEGSVIVIERRGQPIAELHPTSGPLNIPAGGKAAFFGSMRETWARLPQFGDSTTIVEEDRDR